MNASDGTTTKSSALVSVDAIAAVNPDTWATASLIGSSLEAQASATMVSALATSHFYKAFLVTYNTDFGGKITATVDYTMEGSDGFAPNPSAPFADVFANVNLDVWAFDPLPSVSPY